ncbi:unnamed protein product [Linum trigynum]|uniref:Uncharacterized protein n=1 Tax=Linum trigynum TaxID=586398 RepID=A0AAV2CL68_9ROSI
MQQSRFLVVGRRLLLRAPPSSPARGFSSGGRTADPDVFSKQRDREVQPAVPSGQPEETRDHVEPDNAKREEKEPEHRPTSETDPLSPPRPPHASYSRLESVGVHNPAEPHAQQKRSKYRYMSSSAATSAADRSLLDGVTCTGISPWPDEEEEKGKGQSKAEAAEDDREYFEHHKASPLSEIEFADTRKPITRETDDTADAESRGADVVGWGPEQSETAEETMMRASWNWRERAASGDPDTPQGRVLRALRREWF